MGIILSITKKDIKIESNSIQLKDHKNNSTYLGFFNDELKYLLQIRIKNLNVNDLIINRGQQVIQDRLTKFIINISMLVLQMMIEKIELLPTH